MRSTPTFLVAAALVAFAATTSVSAQVETPAYVDDSPLAWELFQRAEDHLAMGPGSHAEAVRAFQELLDDYTWRLIPVTHADAASARFAAVRSRVLEQLRSNEQLLRRYRTMQTPEAERLLATGDLERLAATRPLTEPGAHAMLVLSQQDLEHGRFRAAVDRLEEALKHPDLERDHFRAAHAWFMLAMAHHYLAPDRMAPVETAAIELSLLGEPGETLLAALEKVVGLKFEADEWPTPHLDRQPSAVDLQTSFSSLDRAVASDLAGLVAEEIWWVELNESPLARRLSPQAVERRFPGRPAPPPRDEGRLATIVPTVVGDVVYVNQGHTVAAFDRFTGTRVWTRDYVDRSALMLVDRDDEPMTDASIVAVEGDRLVTFTGHAHSTARSSDGRVVCLNAHTGEFRWGRRLDRLVTRSVVPRAQGEDAGVFGPQEFEGLFPHSAPIIVDDIVILEARRVSPQSLTSAYVVALELETGEVRWVRHVVSSGSIRRAARPFSALTYNEGNLYVVSAIGAVASIRARTGEVNWLHRFPVPLNPLAHDLNRRPWELITAVITKDRVVALQAGHRRVAVYDRATGETLEQREVISRDAWNSPTYLLGDGDWLFAVGREIRAFRLDDLSEPVWRLPDHSQSGDMNPSADETSLTPFELRGRVQVTDIGLIVPTVDALLIVARETGETTHRLPFESSEITGNVVAMDSQLIIASERRMSAYMSLDRAEQMLRERIAATPSNPEPALSLARLALRAGDYRLTLEAAGMALVAIDGSPAPEPTPPRTPRDRLVSILLDLDRAGLARNRSEIEALFALLESAARTETQRLSHRLAYGDRLVSLDPDRAMAVYHNVLADPALAGVQREEGDVIRLGRQWATLRIASVLERHGRSVYDEQESTAQMELAALLRRGRPSGIDAEIDLAEQFFALANSFPFADAAVEAVLTGSQRLAPHRPQQALAAVIGFARSDAVRDPQNKEKLIETYIAMCEELGLSARARAAEASPRADAQTRAAIGAATAAYPAQIITGRLLAHAPGPERVSGAPTDRALVRRETDVAMVAPPSAAGPAGKFETLWSVPIASGLLGPDADSPEDRALRVDVRVIRWTSKHVILWLDVPDDARAVMLDSKTGRILWRSPRVSQMFGQPMPAARAASEFRTMPNGAPFDARATLVMADDHVLVVARRSGDVAAFALNGADVERSVDLSNPTIIEPRWAHRAESRQLSEIHLARLRGGLLVLSGTAQGIHAASRRTLGSGATDPAVVVLDAVLGEPILRRAIHPVTGPAWMEIDPSGQLFYATSEEIAAVDLWTGRHMWTNISAATSGAKRGWLLEDGQLRTGRRLVYENHAGDLQRIDVATGEVQTLSPKRVADAERPAATRIGSGPVHPRDGEFGQLVSAEAIGGDDLAHYRQRIIRFGLAGEVRGMDVVRGDRNFTWLLRGVEAGSTTGGDRRVAERLVLINALQPTQALVPGGSGGARRTQHLHHLYVLTETGAIVGEPAELPPLPESIAAAQLIDGWLLVSLTEFTVAIPMP